MINKTEHMATRFIYRCMVITLQFSLANFGWQVRAFASNSVSVAGGKFQVVLGDQGRITVQTVGLDHSGQTYTGDEVFKNCQTKIPNMANLARQSAEGNRPDLSSTHQANYFKLIHPIAEAANPMLQEGSLDQSGLEPPFSQALEGHNEYIECIDVFNISGLRDYSQEKINEKQSYKIQNLYEVEDHDLLVVALGGVENANEIKNMFPECKSSHAQTQDFDQCMDFFKVYEPWNQRELELERKTADELKSFGADSKAEMEANASANTVGYSKQVEAANRNISHYQARIDFYNEKIVAFERAKNNIPTTQVLKRYCMQGINPSTFMAEYLTQKLTPLNVTYSGSDERKCHDEEFLNGFLENQQMIKDIAKIIDINKAKITVLNKMIGDMKLNIEKAQAMADRTEGQGKSEETPGEDKPTESAEGEDQNNGTPEETKPSGEDSAVANGEQPAGENTDKTQQTSTSDGEKPAPGTSTAAETTTTTDGVNPTSNDTTQAVAPSPTSQNTSTTPTSSSPTTSSNSGGGGGGALLLVGGAAAVAGGIYLWNKNEKEKEEEREEEEKRKAQEESQGTTITGGTGTGQTQSSSDDEEQGDGEKSLADLYRGMHEDQVRAAHGKPTEEREYSFSTTSKNLYYRFRDTGGITCDAYFKIDTASSTVISLVTEGDEETCESYLRR